MGVYSTYVRRHRHVSAGYASGRSSDQSTVRCTFHGAARALSEFCIKTADTQPSCLDKYIAMPHEGDQLVWEPISDLERGQFCYRYEQPSLHMYRGYQVTLWAGHSSCLCMKKTLHFRARHPENSGRVFPLHWTYTEASLRKFVTSQGHMVPDKFFVSYGYWRR